MPRLLAALLLTFLATACHSASQPPAQSPSAPPPASEPPPDAPAPVPAPLALRVATTVHYNALAVAPDEGLYQSNASDLLEFKLGVFRDAATFERFVEADWLHALRDATLDFEKEVVVAVIRDRDTHRLTIEDVTMDGAGAATVTIAWNEVPPHRANLRPGVFVSLPRAGLSTVFVKLSTGETIGTIAVR